MDCLKLNFILVPFHQEDTRGSGHRAGVTEYKKLDGILIEKMTYIDVME